MAVDPASRHADPSQDAAVASPAEGAAGFLIGETPEKDPWAAGQHAPAIGPWKLAGRRLRRNKLALGFLGLFILLVVACLLAPFYSKHIAQIGPNTNNVTGTVDVRGHQENVVSLDGVPDPSMVMAVLLGGPHSCCVLLCPVATWWWAPTPDDVCRPARVGRTAYVNGMVRLSLSTRGASPTRRPTGCTASTRCRSPRPCA